MSLAALAAILGLAAFDALNPSTIAQAAVLSGGARPVRAVLAFWSGALLTYLAFGTLLVLGPGALIQQVVTDPPQGLRLAGLIVGPALAVAGVAALLRRRRKDAPSLSAALRRPRANAAFALGMLSTAVDAVTAAPYFAASAIVTGSDLSFAGKLGVLGLYNVVYLAPVLGVLGLRLALGARADRPLDRFFAVLDRIARPALAALAVVGGAALTVTGAQAV